MSIPSVVPSVSSLVTFSIFINGQNIPGEYQVESIIVNREINKIGTARIVFFDGSFTGLKEDFPAANSSLFNAGNELQIKVGYNSKEELIYEGIIIKQGIRLSEERCLLNIECKESAIKLTTTRKNSIFPDKKDSDIMSEIIKKNGLTATVETTTVKYPEIVQYYCSDWDFILARADLNGMIVIPEGKKINISKPDIDGKPVVEAANGKGIYSINIETDARNQFTKVSSAAWDYSSQKIIKSYSKPVPDVKAGKTTSELSKVLSGSEYPQQSMANLPNNLLESWATAKLIRSKLSKIQGIVRLMGNAQIKPGVLISLSGLSDTFNGSVYVSGVQHIVEEGDWITEAKLGLSFKSYAEEIPDIEAPTASGLIPGIKGLHIGIVKKIHEDKDGQHRIQISYPTVQQDNLGVWARLSTFYATKDSGAFFIPEINDEVIVGFINEDPLQPIILGSVYSSKNTPPFTSEEKNTIKALVTKSRMKISFDEEKKIITIETPSKSSVVLDDDQGAIVITDKNNNKVELNKDGITFDCVKDFTVKSKGKITLEAQQDIVLKATGNLKGEGMAVEVKGSTKFAAEGAMAELKGSAQTVIKGGMVMIN